MIYLTYDHGYIYNRAYKTVQNHNCTLRNLICM